VQFVVIIVMETHPKKKPIKEVVLDPSLCQNLGPHQGPIPRRGLQQGPHHQSPVPGLQLKKEEQIKKHILT